MVASLLDLLPTLLRTGDGKSTHFAKVVKGLMVPPIKTGPRASRYVDYEVDAVVAARVSGQSDEQIRELVKKLVAGRALVFSDQVGQLPTVLATANKADGGEKHATRAGEKAAAKLGAS